MHRIIILRMGRRRGVGSRTKLYACALLIIDGLGNATWSSTMPVSRFRTASFYRNCYVSFPALVALEPLVSLMCRFSACSVKISGDRETDTQTKNCDPRCACARRGSITSHALSMYPVVRVGFEETSLTVSESQESVDICVNSTSPGIEEDFTVNITSDNEGIYVVLCCNSIFSFSQVYFKRLNFLAMFHATRNISIQVTYACSTLRNAMIFL